MKSRSKFSKQILSLVLALVMVFGMLPMTAFAADSDSAATIKFNGEVVAEYAEFEPALRAAEKYTADMNAEVILNKDVQIGSGQPLSIYGGVFTLDLNDHKITTVTTVVLKVHNAKITIKNGKLYSTRSKISVCDLEVHDSNVTIENITFPEHSYDCDTAVGIYNSTVNILSGTFSSETGVEVNSGAVNIKGGNFKTEYVLDYYNGAVNISGGTFNGGIDCDSLTLNECLADGYAFWQGEKMIIPAAGQKRITGGTVVVKEACLHPDDKITYDNTIDTHHVRQCSGCKNNIPEDHVFVNNKCSVCHYICTHSWNSATCQVPETCQICKMTQGSTVDHNLTYTADDDNDVIIESCSFGCDHSATAELQLEKDSYPYAAEFIEPAKVEYSDNWLGERSPENITYKNNFIVSGYNTASVKFTVSDQSVSRTFQITPADIADATITLTPASETYTGMPHERPNISVTWKGMELWESVYGDYTVDWGDENTDYTDVGAYAVVIEGIGSFEGTTTVYFEIAGAELENVTVQQEDTLTYNGEPLTPNISTSANAVNDHPVTFEISLDGNDYFSPEELTLTEAGEYKIYYRASAPNHKDATGSFPVTIGKADQDAPVGVDKTDETISAKNDGVITGVDSTMEYRKDGEDTYTAITGTEVTGLAAGTYFVRYKETDNYKASPEMEVTIAAGRKLTVTLPENQVGYTLTVDEDKAEIDYGEGFNLSFKVHDGYTRVDGFAVNLNGMPLVEFQEDTSFRMAECYENVVVTVEGVADITAPTAEIQLQDNKWNQFWNDITFGLFFKNTQDVTIAADDKGSGVEKVYYYLSDCELEVSEITDWQEYNGTFQINPENQYIIYAKAVDKDGNTVYINSKDGIVLDSIAPVISGIENGATYYTTQKVTVTDENLVTDSVTLNGDPVTGSIVLDGNKDATYTIAAKDKAGNSTTVTVTMKPIRELAKVTENLTNDNVTSDDADALNELVAKLDELIADPDTSDDGEREILEQHKVIAEGLLETIDDTKAELARIDEKMNEYSDDAVKSTDIDAIEQIIEDIDAQLGTDNLTEEEKETLEEMKTEAEALLEKIEETAAEKERITEAVESYDESTVTSDSKEDLEQLVEDIDALLETENLTEDEKDALEETKDKTEGLLETIDDAAKAADTENIEKVKDVTPENVTPEDKTDLEKAKNDLEKALEDHGDNYTDDEKKAIEDAIKRIDDALEVIEKVEAVEELISKLPDEITSEDGKAVEDAYDAYEELSEYEKSLVNDVMKKVLDEAQAVLAELNNPGGKDSPDTGDHSKLWLWFTLLFVSCVGIFGIIMYDRKRKAASKR